MSRSCPIMAKTLLPDFDMQDIQRSDVEYSVLSTDTENVEIELLSYNRNTQSTKMLSI